MIGPNAACAVVRSGECLAPLHQKSKNWRASNLIGCQVSVRCGKNDDDVPIWKDGKVVQQNHTEQSITVEIKNSADLDIEKMDVENESDTLRVTVCKLKFYLY